MMSGWNSKLGHFEDLLASKSKRASGEERRNSVSKIFRRLRSGSLPSWIGLGGGDANQSQASPDKDADPEPPDISCIGETEMSLMSGPRLAEEYSSSRTRNSDSGNSSIGTWTTSIGQSSMVRCSDDAGPSSSSSSPNDTEECGNYHGAIVLRDDRDSDDPNLIYPSPFLMEMESSPLTTKKQFTIVPCGKDVLPELDSSKVSKRKGNQNLGLIVSALYGKLLVVMGIAFPMAEVISTYIPPSFYDGFYLYLYFGSITFMICVYGNMLRQKATRSMRCTLQRINVMRSRFTSGSGTASSTDHPEDVSTDSEGCGSGCAIDHLHHYHHHYDHDHIDHCRQRIHFGSFYLRMGAVAFGIGSMIYSGLEFGQYFELDPDTKCHNLMIALTPAVRMIFTFMQMYFIFLNSKMAIEKLGLGAQFGLMHMIGTNLAVWLNVLVQETRHEILMFYNPDNDTIMYPSVSSFHSHSKNHLHYGHGLTTTTTLAPTPMTTTAMMPTTATFAPLRNASMIPQLLPVVNSTVATIVQAIGIHHRVKRGLKGPYSFLECRRSDIMGSLVQNASPFLFPCTIEYSLICAAILYVMWKSMATMKNRKFHHGHYHGGDISLHAAKRSPHHYSVDCARANKGLFLGIFVLVMTIISLILFFVFITRPGYQALAVMEVNITELVLYSTTTVAVLIGMCQMRELRYVRSRNLELDSILLIVSQTGSLIYNVFSIIGGHFTMKKNTALVLITALSSLIQVLFQTLFILDASKRSAATAEQVRRKPGREVVTFLLVTNLAMWAINTLEKSRADSHPVQLKFYGVWAWAIVTHVSMPLAIFYRFHSTVTLFEIWKRCGKPRVKNIYR